MVEVDPAVLIAGSAVIATLVGVVVCMGSSHKEQKQPVSSKEGKSKSSSSSKAKKASKAAQPEKKSEKKAEKKTETNVSSSPVASTSVVEESPSNNEGELEPPNASKSKKKAKETPEQRAARLERQKIAKQKKADEQAAAALAAKELALQQESNALAKEQSMASAQKPVAADGWAVVEDRRKKKSKPVESKPKEVAAEEVSQPVSSVVTEQVVVENKKIGAIIGTKGATLNAIQDLTGATLNMPKDRDNSGRSSVSVSGTAEAVSAATKIVQDLNVKGYSKALEGDNFTESALSVKSSSLSDLIGKNGSCIRAIQDKTGVKISIPSGNDGKARVRIGIAGSPEGITEAKRIMNDILTCYHSEVTHPGVVHVALDVPERMYNMIIGSKGSEIKHIQNNYKVSVYIPNSDSTHKAVLVVGQKSAVEGAKKYIEKIVSNVAEEEAQANSIAETWNEQQSNDVSNEGDEPWMSQYSYDREQKVSLISKSGEEILLKAQASAWKESTSAEGW